MRTPLLLLFVFLSCQTMAEEITFNMSVWGFTFGKMVVTRTIENDSTELYTLNAKGKVNFLWMKKKGTTNYEVRIRNGKMLSSNYTRTVNGETEYWNEVQFDGDKYQVTSNKGNRHFTEVPSYTVLALYFKPITNQNRIYCEAESEFSTISERQENGFELSCTDGSRTSYHLKDGKVNRLDIHASLATVKIKRVD